MKRPLNHVDGYIKDADGRLIGTVYNKLDAERMIARLNGFPDLFVALTELEAAARAVDEGLSDYKLVILAGERARLTKAIKTAKELTCLKDTTAKT